jgi:hypothetical protein
LQRKLTSRSDVKARSAVLKPKKRHVKKPTRLPTKRMATACWAFIVATRIGRKTAPMLDFSALRVANTNSYQQLINKPPVGFLGTEFEPLISMQFSKMMRKGHF